MTLRNQSQGYKSFLDFVAAINQVTDIASQ
jgi:hypothetical protein